MVPGRSRPARTASFTGRRPSRAPTDAKTKFLVRDSAPQAAQAGPVAERSARKKAVLRWAHRSATSNAEARGASARAGAPETACKTATAARGRFASARRRTARVRQPAARLTLTAVGDSVCRCSSAQPMRARRPASSLRARRPPIPATTTPTAEVRLAWPAAWSIPSAHASGCRPPAAPANRAARAAGTPRTAAGAPASRRTQASARGSPPGEPPHRSGRAARRQPTRARRTRTARAARPAPTASGGAPSTSAGHPKAAKSELRRPFATDRPGGGDRTTAQCGIGSPRFVRRSAGRGV